MHSVCCRKHRRLKDSHSSWFINEFCIDALDHNDDDDDDDDDGNGDDYEDDDDDEDNEDIKTAKRRGFRFGALDHNNDNDNIKVKE